MAKRFRPAAFCLIFLLLAALFAGGCGNKREEGERDGKDGAFDSSRMPGIGSVYEYLVNTPVVAESQGIPVSFSLEGSWDFTSGPSDATTRVTGISPQGMPGSELFPESNICQKSETSGETTYTYFLQDETARKLMGRYLISNDGSESWDRYAPYKTILRFPLDPENGELVPEVTTYTNSRGFSQEISSLFAVVWIDTIKLPAGEFEDAVMIQYFETYTGGGYSGSEIDYSWYVPDVGPVAYLRSMPDEAQPAFNRAAGVRRLASYQVPE